MDDWRETAKEVYEKDGRRGALEYLCNRFFPALIGYHARAFSNLPSQDIEDSCQEAFMEAVQRFDPDRIDTFDSYLFTIAGNKCKGRARTPAQIQTMEVMDRFPEGWRESEALVMPEGARAELGRRFRRLHRKTFLCLVLRRVLRYGREEISRSLHLSEGTISNHSSKYRHVFEGLDRHVEPKQQAPKGGCREDCPEEAWSSAYFGQSGRVLRLCPMDMQIVILFAFGYREAEIVEISRLDKSIVESRLHELSEGLYRV